jgi:quercetin dioxygenase-like cupin family protein
MAQPNYLENEANILGFSREALFEGVHMARVALRKGETSTYHLHTKTSDVFFVMSGQLTIAVRIASPERMKPYQSLPSTLCEIQRTANGEYVHRLRVNPGEVVVIQPGTVHCAMNLAEAPCHFVCIEGVGEYDFVEASTRQELV